MLEKATPVLIIREWRVLTKYIYIITISFIFIYEGTRAQRFFKNPFYYLVLKKIILSSKYFWSHKNVQDFYIP